ncbi:MAG: ATP-binding protein [Candidatus Ornithomonoglobus sp.]
MIQRDVYLDQLKRFRGKNLIKVVTGIRRCGKSTLFELFREFLKSDGVAEEQIISINLEDGDYRQIRNADALYGYVNERILKDKMNYVFLDEVQQAEQFQRAVDWLYVKKNVDLYITGSNAFLLSGELATLISGRYVEIKMLPLSFKEYASAFPQNSNYSALYMNYLQNSSFPGALELTDRKDIRIYLEGIYTSIMLKDVVSRKNIKNTAMLESMIMFMFDNIGNICSSTKIANTMTSIGRKISAPTVEEYLTALCDSYILYKARRYDVKGRQYLSTGYKYYAADIGLRYFLLGTKQTDIGHILENIVYLELLRRYNEVYVGKAGNAEIDFIAVNDEGEEYYQVALTVTDEKTLARELAPLEAAHDHNPKYLLTMDYSPIVSHNGIRQINVLDWLMK